MKKLLVLLMVLGIAAPSMADVTLTGSMSGTSATIGYSFSGATTEFPRAFALTLDTQNPAVTITAVTPAKTGVSVSTSKGFGIFPGTIVINSAGVVTSDGTPVEPATLPGAAGTGIGQQTAIVALGSLYVGDVNKPAASGNLFTVTFSGACTLKVTPEVTYRGGVVDESAAAVAATPNPLFVAPPCFPSTRPLEYAQWVSVGMPTSWCNPRQCNGDADGLTEKSGKSNVWVGMNDLAIMTVGFRASYTGTVAPAWIASDFDRKTEKSGKSNVRVGINDLAILTVNFRSSTVATDCMDANPAK